MKNNLIFVSLRIGILRPIKINLAQWTYHVFKKLFIILHSNSAEY